MASHIKASRKEKEKDLRTFFFLSYFTIYEQIALTARKPSSFQHLLSISQKSCKIIAFMFDGFARSIMFKKVTVGLKEKRAPK